MAPNEPIPGDKPNEFKPAVDPELLVDAEAQEVLVLAGDLYNRGVEALNPEDNPDLKIKRIAFVVDGEDIPEDMARYIDRGSNVGLQVDSLDDGGIGTILLGAFESSGSVANTAIIDRFDKSGNRKGTLHKNLLTNAIKFINSKEKVRIVAKMETELGPKS